MPAAWAACWRSAWRRRALAPKLVDALTAQGAEDMVVICGGVIPPDDYEYPLARDVKAIFGPGTNIPEAAAHVPDLVRESCRPQAAAYSVVTSAHANGDLSVTSLCARL